MKKNLSELFKEFEHMNNSDKREIFGGYLSTEDCNTCDDSTCVDTGTENDPDSDPDCDTDSDPVAIVPKPIGIK